MNYVVSTKSNFRKPQAWTVNRPTNLRVQPKQLDVVTRRYEIEWLSADGVAETKTCVAPALPVFERAFSAFVQGALIQTDKGYVAIEDLRPGAMIATADGGLQPLLWIGSMTMFPNQHEMGLSACQMARITEGGYGHDSSCPDLMTGPAARILPGVMAVNSSSKLVNPGTLNDGRSVICVNVVSPMRVFHIAVKNHGLVRANGVLAESYHPGKHPHMEMEPELYNHFDGLFPHLDSVDDFGPLNHQRND